MKISEITYNTDISKFLDCSKVEEEMSALESAIQSIRINLVEQLSNSTKTENGGLDPQSFNLEGEALLTNEATKCETSFTNILEQCSNLKDRILNSAVNHRQGELTKYISCIEERIDNIEVLRNNVVKQIEEETKKYIFDRDYIEVTKLYIHKENYERELKKLYEKLDWSKKELGKV